MDLLNNREIATGIWLLILLAYILRFKDVRKSFTQLFNSFFVRGIQIPLFLMLIYSLGSVWLLNEIGLWDSNQIKNVVFWFCGGALISFMNINKESKEENCFTNILKSHLKLIVLIQFILTVNTFSLIVELFVVAIASLMVGVMAYSKNKEEYNPSFTVCERGLNIVGLAVAINTIYQISINWGSFVQIKTALDFLVPTSLSVMLIPYLYLLVTFIVYQEEFTRLKFHIKDDSLRWYAFMKSMFRFHFRFNKYRRWVQLVSYNNVNTKQEVNESIDTLFCLLKKESNPPKVDESLGWCPYKAKDFLIDEGLKTNNYKMSAGDDNDWFCNSESMAIESGLLLNNITYGVEGNSIAATKLKLRLNIYYPDEKEEAHSYFVGVVNSLLEKALGFSLSPEAIEAIEQGNEGGQSINDKEIIIEKKEWNNGLYGFKFEISHLNA